MTWGPLVGYVVVGLLASGMLVSRQADFREESPAVIGFCWVALGLLWPVLAAGVVVYFVFAAIGRVLLRVLGR